MIENWRVGVRKGTGKECDRTVREKSDCFWKKSEIQLDESSNTCVNG